MSSDTYALVLALAVGGYTALVTLMDRRLSTMIVLHNVAWTVALLVVGSGLLNYRPLSITAWLIITGAIVAFNVGSVAGATLKRDQHPPAVEPLRLIPLWAYCGVVALFSIGLAVYLLTISRLYDVSTLVTDPVSIRGDSETGYLAQFPLYGKLLFYFGPLAFVLTAFPRLVNGLSRVPLSLRVALLGYLAVGQVALLQRTNLFTSALWALGVYLVASAHGDKRFGVSFRLRRVLMVAVLCAVAFQVIAVALEKTASDDSGFRYAVDAQIRDSPAAMALHYAASGVPAFGALVDSRNDVWPVNDPSRPLWGSYNPQTWGLATFAAPAKAVPGVDGWLDLAPFVRLPAPTNVYTWLEPWYRDYRAPGVVIGSFLMGLVVALAFRIGSGSVSGLLLAGHLVGMSAFATFTNRYSSVLGISLLIALAGLWFIIRVAHRSTVPNGAAAEPPTVQGRRELG